MRRLLILLLLSAAALRARAGVVAVPASAIPRIIFPAAAFGETDSTPHIIVPQAPALSVGAPPALIVPGQPVILAPAPVIVIAARALTEEEAAPAKMPSRSDLERLADSLAPTPDASNEGAPGAGRARLLDAAFDGTLAPEASDWNDLSKQFAAGPLAPGLPVVAAAARSLVARLLPDYYRRVPALAAYDKTKNRSTGHTWTPEKGHLIKIAPVSPDSTGAVPSSFGSPGVTYVQQKIEQLMEYAHEYFHVIFDAGVGKKEIHPAHSAYAAMTEGFAVAGEQLLIARMLDMAPALGLSPRDAADLAAISAARRRWLDVEDNHYSEGIISWRKAYEEDGAGGGLSFLAALSARRMAAVPRFDPAYQLALGEPKLLAAYLGRDEASPARRGLDAFAKAADGKPLTDEEAREAAVIVEQAGPDGWRRVFDRTLRGDKRLGTQTVQGDHWWEDDLKPLGPVEAAFALARLSPSAAAALSHYLAETIAARRGAALLFERAGPNAKLDAIAAGAEALPWDANDRKAWSDGLARWLIGG